MEIPIISNSVVQTLYADIEINLNKYINNEVIIEDKSHIKGLQNTELSMDLFSNLNLNDSLSEGEMDANNSYLVYKGLKNLSPHQARDERIWCALCHLYFNDYIFKRHKIKNDSKLNNNIIKRFFARGLGGRSIEVNNALARLWWHGYFIDSCREEYQLEELLKVFCLNTDFRAQLLERPEISKIPKVRLAIILCKRQLEKEDVDTCFFKRKGKNLPLYRLWFQKISLEGGRKLFSTMKLNDLMDLFWGYMNEIKSQ